MNLLMASSYFESHRGGIEVVVGQLARELHAVGTSVAWLASDATMSPPLPGPCGRPIAIHALNATERLLGIPFPIPGIAALRTICKEVDHSDIVLLHDALYPSNIAAFLFARWARKPVVLTQHIASVPYRNSLLRGLMRVLNRVITRPLLASANQVVFISEVTAGAFADVSYRNPPRLIFNGVDTDIYRPTVNAAERSAARQHFGLPLDRRIALFVGRFVEKKGLDVLHHAARMDRDTVWVLAGWGRLDPASWKLPNVRVFPGLSGATLAPLYRASDAFVLPSIGEGFPLVLQEALASGLPTICGAESARADKNAGALLRTIQVDVYKSETTAAQLIEALHGAIRENTPDQAAQRAGYSRKSYSWPSAAKLYLDLFNDIAGTNAIASSKASQARPAMETNR